MERQLLDPLGRSSIMEETVMSNKSALFQSDPTSASATDATMYVQTNLVSDIPGVATAFDPHLVNPWGVSFRTRQPLLGLEPGLQFDHSLLGDRQHRHQSSPSRSRFHSEHPDHRDRTPGPHGTGLQYEPRSFPPDRRQPIERQLHLRQSQRDDLRLEQQPRDKRVNRAHRSDDGGRRLYRIGSRRSSYDALRRQHQGRDHRRLRQ